MKQTFIATVAIVLALPSTAWAQADPKNHDVSAVEQQLARYIAAVEKLDAAGTEALFTADSQMFETGSSEGSYANYLAHHLKPELAGFKSFKFSDYKVNVRFEGPVALATETYRFRIEPKSGDAVERMGVATSVLRKVAGTWKIVIMHNSGRRPKPS